MGVTPALEARMLEMIGEARTCPHGHPIGDYPREPGVPLTAAPAGSTVRILRFENEDHDLLRMFRRAGVEPKERYTVVSFGEDLARLEGPQGEAELPLYAARTISVAVERAGDGPAAEQDPESLATAYLLGETHWSR
jgi:DtxR family Mn-dependent transcriptional regulator